MTFALRQPVDFNGFAVLALVTQVVVILSPALLMTVMLTRSPRKTLLLNWPNWWSVPVAVLLAVALHPSINLMHVCVMRLYPVSESLTKALEKLLADPQSLWLKLLVIAVVPAICEELAFRGFVLSGLRHSGSKWRAIAVSSLFFGLAHAIFQQSLTAGLMGLVLGYIAVQTGSLLPCVLFHATHNSLQVLMEKITPELLVRHPWLGGVFRLPENAAGEAAGAMVGLYQPQMIALSGLLSLAILYAFHRVHYSRTAEERLHETLDRPAPQPVG